MVFGPGGNFEYLFIYFTLHANNSETCTTCEIQIYEQIDDRHTKTVKTKYVCTYGGTKTQHLKYTLAAPKPYFGSENAFFSSVQIVSEFPMVSLLSLRTHLSDTSGPGFSTRPRSSHVNTS